MSVLTTPDDDGERLSLEEAIATCVLLLQAGHETTADLLGNALVALFRHPDELRFLRDHADATRPAVEELLRYDCSVQMSMRLVTDDLEVEGTVIPAGSLAALVYGAANHDPARFADPDRLDLRRNPTHLAFSVGAYYCLGNALGAHRARVGSARAARPPSRDRARRRHVRPATLDATARCATSPRALDLTAQRTRGSIFFCRSLSARSAITWSPCASLMSDGAACSA